MVERVPPSPAQDAVPRHLEAVAWRQRVHSPKQDVAGAVAAKACAQRVRVLDRLEAVQPQERLELGREREPSRADHDVEGLDSEAVARQHQSALVPIPHGQAPHAVEALEAICPPALERRKDDLRVALGSKRRSGPLESATQLDEVVELAVVGDDETPTGRGHRLMARLAQVQDGEAAVAERDAAVMLERHPPAVRPAVRQCVGEAVDRPPVDALIVQLPDTGDPAHRAALPFR